MCVCFCSVRHISVVFRSFLTLKLTLWDSCGLDDKNTVFDSRHGQEVFLSSKGFGSTVGSAQRPSRWGNMGGLAEVMNEWSCTYTRHIHSCCAAN